jgi:phosphoglycolate phosphatase
LALAMSERERDEQTRGAMPASLACCALIGTMISDSGMVDRAYAEAIATQGVFLGTAAYAKCMAQVHQARGQSEAEVLQAMFPGNKARALAAQLALDRSFCDAVGRMAATPAPGAVTAVEEMARAGIRVCVITSFSRRVLNAVLDSLGWWDWISLALSVDDAPRGFPAPDLILTAMLRLGVTDVRETAVAADTRSAIMAGRRAGAGIVAGVLGGAHSGDRLHRAGATHLIPGIAHLPELLIGAGRRGAEQPEAARTGHAAGPNG